MPMPKRVNVDDYLAQLPKAAVPHLTKLRGLSQFGPHREEVEAAG